MIDDSGRWQKPASRAENRARVAEQGWIWIGRSDSEDAADSTVRVCIRPSVVDGVAMERAMDWLENLSGDRKVELLLLNDIGRELEAFETPQGAIDRCAEISSALAEIRIVQFRNEPMDAVEMLSHPDLGFIWQRVSGLRAVGTALSDAVELASADGFGLTCALTWIGDQVCFTHIGNEVPFRSNRARTAWPGRPLRELGPFDAAAAELLDDLLRFRRPLLHRVEVEFQRRRDPPEWSAHNRLLMLYPTPPGERPVALSVLRPASASAI